MAEIYRHPVLITGSSRGIGRSIAIAFAKEGYSVIITAQKSQKLLEELQQYIQKQFHVQCMTFLGDLGQFETVQELFKQIEERYEGIEILVNNAGISHTGLLSHMNVEEWQTLLATNLSSYFYCCKLAIPYMVSKKHGRILNISSVWGNTGASCEAAYSATKGAINAMTKALGKELAPSGIQVNAIACGVIDTEMNRFLDDEERKILMDEIPIGRFANPDEVADLAVQLIHTSHYMTGQVITFDGGWL